ncbi:TPA: hypothetical protein ACF1UP_002894 [Enterococcus hirae]
MLKRVLNINLKKIDMEDRDEMFQGDNDDLSIAVKVKLAKIAQFDDKPIFSMNARLMLVVSSDEVLRDRFKNIEQIDRMDTLTFFDAVFKIEFETDTKEIDKENIKVELINYIEPYFREFIDNIYNRTEISVPSLPLGITLGSSEE